MLLYQQLPQWKTYMIVLTLLAAFGSFVVEPLFTWMKIYDLNTWEYIYSSPIYIAMGIFVKVVAHQLLSIQEQRHTTK
jgi:hypothetical protein